MNVAKVMQRSNKPIAIPKHSTEVQAFIDAFDALVAHREKFDGDMDDMPYEDLEHDMALYNLLIEKRDLLR